MAQKQLSLEAIGLLRYDDGGVERFVTPQDGEGRRWLASLEANFIENLLTGR